MRTSTKIKRLLEKHTIGLSIGEDGWHLTTIHVDGSFCRANFNADSFGKVVDKAFKSLTKPKEVHK